MAIGPSSTSPISRIQNDTERELPPNTQKRQLPDNLKIPPLKRHCSSSTAPSTAYKANPALLAALSKTSALNNHTTEPLCPKMKPVINGALSRSNPENITGHVLIEKKFLELVNQVNQQACQLHFTPTFITFITEFLKEYETLCKQQKITSKTPPATLSLIIEQITQALSKQQTTSVNTALNQELEPQVADSNQAIITQIMDLCEELETQSHDLREELETQMAVLSINNEMQDHSTPTE